MRLLNVVGARPNLLKIASLMHAYDEHPEIDPILIHTGQHYDRAMSELFFEELGIPEPTLNLGVGSATHAIQTAEIMRRFEPVLLDTDPHAVGVVGDVNSTVACGLVAVEREMPLVHVEAGLRSFDRTMPEEINRVLTDAISDLLFCTEPSGVENLEREGIDPGRIHFVGNVMIDTLLRHRARAETSPILESNQVDPGAYAVITLHRPANVDRPQVLEGVMAVLASIQQTLPVVFPVHPRTLSMLRELGLVGRLEALPNLRMIDPLGYLDFVKMTANARVVLTDSGVCKRSRRFWASPVSPCARIRSGP